MLPDLSPLLWSAVLAVTLAAGLIKGVVGFAMPMVMISGLGSLLPAELALAALILPTLLSNLAQSLRDGFGAALLSARRHWRYVLTVCLAIVVGAQFVRALPGETLYLVLGGPITLFALVQLAGVRPTIPAGARRAAEIGFGLLAGLIGGISGVWGPPTVLYLTALALPKVEQLRVQGIVYGLGSLVLAGAHLETGVLNRTTLPLSALLIFPAVLGTLLGARIADRLDQAAFRRATLVVLVLAGLNLVRRGLAG